MNTHDKPVDDGRINGWVLFIVGLILLVLAVNIFMVYLAVNTGPGLVVDDYYERGKSFTSRTKLETTRKRSAGATGALQVTLGTTLGESSTIILAPHPGHSLPEGKARLYLYRSSDATRDFSVPMTQDDRGRVTAQVTFPLKGYWDLIAEISHDDTDIPPATFALRIKAPE